jgi:hypothetical protein
MVYSMPLFRITLWTSAICAETEADGVPIGTKQKSATHFGGVANDMMGVSRDRLEEADSSRPDLRKQFRR